MVGGGGGDGVLSPLENEKKRLSEEILTSFTYVLLMKLMGDQYTIHAKWKEVGGQALILHGGRRWGAWGLCPPQLRK